MLCIKSTAVIGFPNNWQGKLLQQRMWPKVEIRCHVARRSQKGPPHVCQYLCSYFIRHCVCNCVRISFVFVFVSLFVCILFFAYCMFICISKSMPCCMTEPKVPPPDDSQYLCSHLCLSACWAHWLESCPLYLKCTFDVRERPGAQVHPLRLSEYTNIQFCYPFLVG